MIFILTFCLSSILTICLDYFLVQLCVKQFAIDFVLSSPQLVDALTSSNRKTAELLVKNSRFFIRLVSHLNSVDVMKFKLHANIVALRVREQLVAKD